MFFLIQIDRMLRRMCAHYNYTPLRNAGSRCWRRGCNQRSLSFIHTHLTFFQRLATHLFSPTQIQSGELEKVRRNTHPCTCIQAFISDVKKNKIKKGAYRMYLTLFSALTTPREAQFVAGPATGCSWQLQQPLKSTNREYQPIRNS